MKNIVVVFTCNNSINTFGGIKTILDSYAQQESVFESFGYKLFFFNYKPNLLKMVALSAKPVNLAASCPSLKRIVVGIAMMP